MELDKGMRRVVRQAVARKIWEESRRNEREGGDGHGQHEQHGEFRIFRLQEYFTLTG